MSVRSYSGLTPEQRDALLAVLNDAAYKNPNAPTLIAALESAITSPANYGIGKLYLNGVDLSSEFHLYVSGKGTYGGSARAYEPQSIPGRNGDLLFYDSRLENVEIVYHCFFPPADFEDDIADLRDYLLGSGNVGYQRIEDTYHPDEFRLGYFEGPFEPEVMDGLQTAQFDLVFKCKPQRFLKSGEEPITVNGGSARVFSNPSTCIAKPLIKVYGTGRLFVRQKQGDTTVRTRMIDVMSNTEHTYIDCDLMDAYELVNGAPVNRNNSVKLTNNEFPYFDGKKNGLVNQINVMSSTEESGLAYDQISKIEVYPRWWRA